MASLLARGAAVGLRDLTQDDVGEHYLRWLQDPDVTRYLEARFVDHTLDSLRAFVLEQSTDPRTLLLAIVRLDDERHIGNVKVGPLEPHHGTADLGIMIGDRGSRGRGFGAEAIRLASALAFERLGARKLTASCYSGNGGSARAFARAGWQAEGARPAQYLDDDGGVHDQLLFGLLAPC